MVPLGKRKSRDEDFIFTLSDNEQDSQGDDQPSAPARKRVKAPKKSIRSQDDLTDEEAGIWGQNDEDDGAMDSDFEFVAGDIGGVAEEFHSLDFENAKRAIGEGSAKKTVDLDEIIRRRREKNNGQASRSDHGVASLHLHEGEALDEGEAGEISLDDDESGVLADDAFGMNVGSISGSEEDNLDHEGGDSDPADEEAASDNDSVATPVAHPEDEEGSNSSSDDDEESEDEARRKAFFAPDEPSAIGNKTDQASFQAMSLSRPILRGLASVGFARPTPIQNKTIPVALMGKDVVGSAVTGSGKTAAFVVPILERLLYRPKKVPTTRVVILTPTRELAIQCHAVAIKLASHTDIKFSLAVGGLSLKAQEVELRLRPDVIIATPGRFIDHMRNSASFAVDTVEILVLDEADRMLEDGFADELNEILTTLPKSRQTLLFSATMTSSVDRLIRAGLDKPVRIMADSQKKTVGTLVQEFVRLRPGREGKRMGYLVYLCKQLYTERTLIFFRQKKIAHRTRIIFGLLGLSCAELHGSMNQTQRITSVEAFRDGKVAFLLATDLASRGLDIKGIDTVINFEAPQTSEIYIHRVGRTARAGRSGVAVTLAAEPDRKVVKAAVKAGKAQGAKIMSRVIEPVEADKWQTVVDEMAEEIDEITQEEKEEKQLAQVEMNVKKGENLIKYEDDIKSRPKRTWFETEKDKRNAKDMGREELNGVRASLKKKHGGKLSNKDKKKLDAKAVRSEGAPWKKGEADRGGKGGSSGRPGKRVPGKKRVTGTTPAKAPSRPRRP